MEINDQLDKYIEILLEYNQKVNLVSRKITPEELKQLLDETFLINNYISESIRVIVDAGSGNGLLGIPLALLNKNKKVILVEPKKKKTAFLREVKEEMKLHNVEVEDVSIEEYLKRTAPGVRTIVARGFPELKVFVDFLKKKMVEQDIMITSGNKIKKNQIHLESVRKKTYNVPLRTNLKILKMEKIPGDKHKKK
ncbi:MAG: hypothetical protein GY940_10995 [bacterium]|nr:hypothetical protein [bacterium]